MAYTKPWRSHEEQLDLLISRGLTVTDRPKSLEYLQRIGYCAHHGRLWNRNIVDQPKLPPVVEVPWVAPFENDNHLRARCFLLLRITRHLLQVVNPNSSWPERMKTHLKAFPDLDHLDLNLTGMGAPRDWEENW